MCIEDLLARSVIHIGMLHVYSETTNSVEKVSEDAKEKLDDGEEGLIKPVTVEGTKWDITHAGRSK